jgi:hypothetical protein
VARRMWTNLAARSVANCEKCRMMIGSARRDTSLCIPIGEKSGIPSARWIVTLNHFSRSPTCHRCRLGRVHHELAIEVAGYEPPEVNVAAGGDSI